MKALELGYADFIALCNVEDPKQWDSRFEVKNDGVYLAELSVSLTKAERASLTEGHPTGNLNEPMLRFPCTLDSVEAFLRNEAVWCVDPFELARWVRLRLAKGSSSEDAPRTQGSVYPVVKALAECLAKALDKKWSQPRELSAIAVEAMAKFGIQNPTGERGIKTYLEKAGPA